MGGGNIDTTTLGRIIDRGLVADRRLLRFELNLPDRPGTLAGLTAAISNTGANVKDLYHDRAWARGAIDMVRNLLAMSLCYRTALPQVCRPSC